jgi:hypothetical protein
MINLTGCFQRELQRKSALVFVVFVFIHLKRLSSELLHVIHSQLQARREM